jgi:hypothetical protein
MGLVDTERAAAIATPFAWEDDVSAIFRHNNSKNTHIEAKVSGC